MGKVFFCIFFLAIQVFSQENEPYLSNKSYTFEGAISAYKSLAAQNPKTSRYLEMGSSDYGLPMPLFIMNSSGDFSKKSLQSKPVILINNAIHAGEPCGVDACIKLSKELLKAPGLLPKNCVIAIIPIYNIGGAHNRNCCSRANQNGPEQYGFRGNAKNLDLNRDFIKADSKNSLAFYAIFHYLKPVIFVDTHTSNGADYQHTMTLITSQLNKMNPTLASFIKHKLNPFLFDAMKKGGYPMVQYMNTKTEIPDDGIVDYLETPRYSTGYTNLFQTIGFVTEAHMLKPFPARVEATYTFLKKLIEFTDQHHEEILANRLKAMKEDEALEKVSLNWVLDTNVYDTIPFLGYAARYKKSEVTGIDRLYYDQTSPYSKYIKYYNTYLPVDEVKTPHYYIIPQQWESVVRLLRMNEVPVYALNAPTNLSVEGYEILTYETTKSAYEGHYLHSNIKVKSHQKILPYRKGDFVVPVRNTKLRFIVETLEPHAVDSYFAWNFFDATLQQKEWFSAYVFEDEAAEMLKNDPALKAEFEKKRANEPEFAASDFAQLYFLYKRSPNYEPTVNLYPITRLMTPLDQSLLAPAQ